MAQRDEAQRGGNRPGSGVRAQVAEQFARYRADSSAGARFDECGRPTTGYYDELVDGRGRVRSMWSELSADFIDQGIGGIDRIDHRVRRQIEDDGVTYTEVGLGGDDDTAIPQPWRLDPIPLLVSAEDWTRLETGLVQRSLVLDEVLTDVYGPRRLLSSGLLPPEVVFGNTGYVRAAHGITIPGTHQLFLHACDISRWSDGQFRVLADWAQAPSGAGYALADRRVVASAIPEAFEHAGPRPLSPFARAMRLMLEEAAPELADGEEPVVVVLSPGSHSETAFDQAYLAQMLGFPLVESSDLVVRDGALWMRSLGSLERVDVVLRRVDAEFSDPLDLRPDSRLGVVGLVEVLRRGAVTVVNTLGSGLLESPALSPFLPRIARSVLGEDLLLDATPSYWGGDDTERAHLVSHVGDLVIRSAVDGSTIFGPSLSAAERADLAARIEVERWKWVGQEPAEFSVAPAVDGPAGLAAAPVGMRLFSLARRGSYTAMSGGLGQQRMRLEPTRSVIKVAAKDVWVRAAPATVPAASFEAPHEERLRRTAPVVEAVSSPRVLNDLFWMGRYSERAESVVRLLAATHDVYQDYRYRPWLDGAEALPILMRALSITTGTVAPQSVLPNGVGQLVAVRSKDGPATEDPNAEHRDSVDAQAPTPDSAATRSSRSSSSEDAGTDAVPHDVPPGPKPSQSASQSQSEPDSEVETEAPWERAGTSALARALRTTGVTPERGAEPVPAPEPEPVLARSRQAQGQFTHRAMDSSGQEGVTARRAVAGASAEGFQYLASLTGDRELAGSLSYAVDHYGSAARAVRDQLSGDTWMIVGAVDRALAEFRGASTEQETALSSVHSLTLAALLSLSGIGAESMVRDTGWYVMDIGKRIERGLAVTALINAALGRRSSAEAQGVVAEAVLTATESAVSYRRRHRGSAHVAALAGLLLFDPGNPRSLIYQLDRLEADFQALPGGSGASRWQRLLADAQRMLRRVDPADLEHTDDDGVRTELVELLEGVHLRLRKLAESFEATKLAVPLGIQPLWGNTRMVG
ncbi:circularly permuted type 2 ATP-grasp protein [Nocardia fluminea]|uniref:Putative circularly permuted ATP-grasp superfamily protein n=1 Tax=Nocardia fluminea TaxID=134984 RepID=A0A2N3V9U6_9NOCA|nr:circularly permuted type 2 ATP-grasp protein [Nocardia fluminea]PKV78383.1 putative circularly permuted ATP-grasp superfamily protein [Nocardia fluminea]